MNAERSTSLAGLPAIASGSEQNADHTLKPYRLRPDPFTHRKRHAVLLGSLRISVWEIADECLQTIRVEQWH